MLFNKFNPNLVYKKIKFTETKKIALIYPKNSSENVILIINKKYFYLRNFYKIEINIRS